MLNVDIKSAYSPILAIEALSQNIKKNTSCIKLVGNAKNEAYYYYYKTQQNSSLNVQNIKHYGYYVDLIG